MGAWHTSKAATNENTGGCDVSKVTTKDQHTSNDARMAAESYRRSYRCRQKTVADAIVLIVTVFRNPLLHARPQPVGWWDELGKRSRRASRDLADALRAAARAEAYTWKRHEGHKALKVPQYIDALDVLDRETIDSCCVAFAFGLSKLVDKATHSSLQEKWAKVERALRNFSQRVVAIEDFDYDDPAATSIWPSGLTCDAHLSGFYVGVGVGGLRVCHAHKLGRADADDKHHVLGIDVYPGDAVDMLCDAAYLTKKHTAPRRDFINTLAQRNAIVLEQELGTGGFIKMLTPSCTEYALLTGAVKNRLPSHITKLAKLLADCGVRRFAKDLANDVDVDVDDRFIADMEEAVWTSSLGDKILKFFLVCVALANDRDVQKTFGAGVEAKDHKVTTVFEMSVRMDCVLRERGHTPLPGYRRVKLRSRVLYVSDTMLPTLELLAPEAVRLKRDAGRPVDASRSSTTMIHDARKAAAIEMALYDAILLAIFADLDASASLAQKSLRESRKRDRRRTEDPAVDDAATASVQRQPRLARVSPDAS